MEFAHHISNWDYNVQITTDCLFDRETNTAFKVQGSESHGRDIMNYEYIELGDGSKIRDFKVGSDDEFINFNQ